MPPERAKAIELWLSDDCWKVHVPVLNKDGCPKAGDYVKVLGAPYPEGKADMQALMPSLVDEVKRVWEAHEASGSTESVGILVRTNDDGNEIAERLRSEGLPVVWEGMSAVSDAGGGLRAERAGAAFEREHRQAGAVRRQLDRVGTASPGCGLVFA